jgi:hypothetical protein
MDAMRAMVVLTAGLILTAAAAAAGFEDPHGLGYDGRDWKTMSEQAKRAYVAGFLAGAVAQQAVDRHRRAPGVSIETAISEIARAHSATFPFGASVYKATLDNYYFYTNNLPIKIYQALIDRNAEMVRGP